MRNSMHVMKSLNNLISNIRLKSWLVVFQIIFCPTVSRVMPWGACLANLQRMIEFAGDTDKQEGRITKVGRKHEISSKWRCWLVSVVLILIKVVVVRISVVV